jgi:Fe-S cluster assembly protein SufD
MTNQTTLPVLPGALQNDPEWFATIRGEALGRYASLALPDRSVEDWRRTDVRFDPDAYAYFAPAGPELPEDVAAVAAAGGVIVQHNSEVVLQRLPDSLAQQGVIFCSLQDAIEKHGDLVRRYLFSRCFDPSEQKLAAQHAAFLAGGAFLYVPKNVEIAEPLSVITWADADGAGIFNHILVVADRFSKVAVHEWLSSAETANILQNGAVEIYAEAGAKVEYIALQTLGGETRAFNSRRARVGRDASVTWYTGDFGGGKTRADQVSYMDEDGGHSEILLLFFTSGEQHMDIGSAMEHTTGRNATSNITARGVLTDSSRGVFRGNGHIHTGAKGCSTYQNERALLLTDDAHHDTIPGLYIDESEVNGAGHGATVGQIDQDQVFYLMSRGLSRPLATRMIVTGFITPILNRIASEPARRKLEALVDRKLGVG